MPGPAQTHGESNKTPEYTAWLALKLRATRSKGRIRVCARWLHSYDNFLTDMGRRPSSEYSIDRKNNEGPYAPGNCRWATAIEQGRNKRTNHLITFMGETKCLAEWAQDLDIKRSCLLARLRSGWDVERALTTTPRKVRQLSTPKVQHGACVGGVPSPEYKVWLKIRYHCGNPSSLNFVQYGKRGIGVCLRWLRSFPRFLSDVGVRPSPRHILGRRNVKLGYTPSNCLWTTRSAQAGRRASKRTLVFRGERHSVTEWATLLGINRATLFKRLHLGWNVKRVLTTEVRYG